MPAISPTTLLVTGSISITLSPAALVCTMRTLAARTVATARTHISTTAHLVTTGTTLSRHVADSLFPLHADQLAAAGVDARLRDVQNQGPAAAPRETSRPCALLRLPLDRHGVPPAAAARGAHGLYR